MNTPDIPVAIHILDKEYRIACQREEKDDLIASARYLDGKMREIKAGGKVIGSDRIAVMAALNLANEVLEQRNRKENTVQNLSKRLQTMQEKIDIALHQGNQLEL